MNISRDHILPYSQQNFEWDLFWWSNWLCISRTQNASPQRPEQTSSSPEEDANQLATSSATSESGPPEKQGEI